MTQSRKHRGMRTQKVVAGYFALHGFPYAESSGAGRSGADLTGTPGLAVEVKARTGFDPLAWVRQAKANAGHMLPIVVVRCNGQGEASVGDWVMMLPLSEGVGLLADAGYGDES